MASAGNKVLDALMGHCVGDALGVPVEFLPREYFLSNPVNDMAGYGTYNFPPGTWSDDSSLSLCLAETLCKGIDYDVLAEKFKAWLYDGYMTPYGRAFGTGKTTRLSIKRLKEGIAPVHAGGTGEADNGNGSLMRILPLVFSIKNMEPSERDKIISDISSVTHGNFRSVLACIMYIEVALNLLSGFFINESIDKMKHDIIKRYSKNPELLTFKRILYSDIVSYSSDEINSSGYVVDTLEASLWCLGRSSDYASAVLSAVNLGLDTDTTAAVTGGLAGIYYGVLSIPSHWISLIARRSDIEALCLELNNIYCGRTHL